MTKQLLRKRVIKTLNQLSPHEKVEIEQKLINQLINSTIWHDAIVIGITISHAFEWDTTPLIKQAWTEGKTVVVPKSDAKDKLLSFYKLTSFDTLKEGYANLLEPDSEHSEHYKKSAIELIIVPGIVFDMQGYRIGFGGGYYDRFLESFNHETVSLVSQLQLINEVPRNEFDIPVNYIATEMGIVPTLNDPVT